MTGDGIKRLRKKAGLTQKGLAHLLGVSRVTVWRWEHDAVTVPPPTLRWVLQVLEGQVAARRDAQDLDLD